MKDNNLDRFRQLALMEYVSVDNVLGEDGPQGPDYMGGGQPPMGDGMGGQQPPMDGGGMPQQGDGQQAQPPQGLAPQGRQQPPTDDGMPQQDDMPQDGAPMGDGMGGQPGQYMGMEADDNAIGEPYDEDIEEIDVDDLTNSQEETEKKVDNLLKKFSASAKKMMMAVDDLSAKIDASSKRLDNMEKEFERRNPTPLEKLSMRSLDSYPFSSKPDEYWQDKELTSNYRVGDDMAKDGEPEYQITKSDIDNFNDYQGVAREMNTRKYSLRDIMNL